MMNEDKSFKVLNVRVYENDWDYSSGINMDIVDGMVRIVEDDHNARKPDTLWREISEISLNGMIQIMDATSTHDICWKTRDYFVHHGIDDFLHLLQENNIEYKYREYTTSWPPREKEMENSEINQEKRNEGKGCLLTGVLLSSVIGALLMAFFYGLSAIVNATTSPVNVAFLLRSSFLFAVSLYSFYAIFQTYKMRKKGAYGLLGVYVVGILSFLLIAFEKTPDSPEAKAGVAYSILFAIINVVYAVILLMNLKKMK